MLPSVRSLLVPELLPVRPVSAQKNVRTEDVTPDVIQMRIHSWDWLHVSLKRRSRVRDDLTFWSTVTSFVTSVVVLVILVNR